MNVSWLKRYGMRIVLGVLACAVLLICSLAWHTFEKPHLTVAFLDIGQGDAIFIQSPTGTQVLLDGGPDNSVLERLSGVMPWYDRTIDMIIPSHPDSDHITGLISVLAHYQVARVVQSSVLGDTATWHKLEQAITDEPGVATTTAIRGQVFDLGGGAYLEILFPDRLLPNVDTNTASIVAKVVYDNTSFLLTGDSPSSIEEYLVSLDRLDGVLESSVLKAGHHGSKNSSSPLYIGTVNPDSVVLSRGCHNSYGHPAPETLATLAAFNETTYDTCVQGTITYTSNGKTVSVTTVH